MADKSSFGTILKKARLDAEISIEEYAEKLKTNPKFIEQVEGDTRKDIDIAVASTMLKPLGYEIVIRKPSTGDKAIKEVAEGLAYYYAYGRMKERAPDKDDKYWKAKAKSWSNKNFTKYITDASAVLKSNNLI